MSAPPPELVAEPRPDELLEQLQRLVAAGDDEALRAFLSGFHPSDFADLLEELEDEERQAVVRIALVAAPALAAEALTEMEGVEHPEEAIAGLDAAQIASVFAEMSDDDAADLIGELEPADRDRVLAALPLSDAGEIRDLLRYDEESAGGLMTTELVSVAERSLAADAIDEVRAQAQAIGDFYSIFVVDDGGRLCGNLALKTLITAAPDQPVAELVEPVVATVGPTMDQEEVGRILSRYNLVSVPVVDEAGRLLGRITFDDVIDAIEAETTEDILKFGGVSEEEEIRGDWAEAVRSRLPWLFVNLITAGIAASVVWYYESTIDALPLLAIWMPIIAGMGGNTGTQALAVTVRRLALSPESSGWNVVGKELLVGLGNGLAIGLSVSVAAWLINGSGTLGLVVLLAMWMNLAVAGFAGAFVPILLERLRVDPAVASSIFVTTFTDLVGFFLLLGLATRLLL